MISGLHYGVYDPMNRVPRIPSCTHVSPSASFPSAAEAGDLRRWKARCRRANGRTALPGQNTKLREWAFPAD